MHYTVVLTTKTGVVKLYKFNQKQIMKEFVHHFRMAMVCKNRRTLQTRVTLKKESGTSFDMTYRQIQRSFRPGWAEAIYSE